MSNFQIHKAIRKRRELLGLTPEEVAKKVGISANSVYRAESGRHAVTEGTLRLIAVALELSSDYFLSDQPVETPTVIPITITLPANWPEEKRLRAIKMLRELAENLIKLIEGEEK